MPTKKCSVEQYLRSIGKVFATVGAINPRHSKLSQLDFRLGRKLATYAKQAPPPTRVCLIPVSILQALDSAYQGGTECQQAISDLAWIAFFFLPKPGEYCRGGADTAHHFFLLRDLHFFIGQHPFNAASPSASPSTRARADFISLLFTTQKNGVKGESIGHGRTGHPQGCPVSALRRRVTYLRCHGATGTTPLAAVRHKDKWVTIHSTDIMAAIHAVVRAAGPTIGFTPQDVSTRSLRAGGAMALLTARVNPDTIWLIGRWRRDTMLRYLHTTSKKFTDGFAVRMFQYGDYVLIPTAHATG